MIVVVSTGLRAPTKDKCLASVATQSIAHRHIYVEAGEQNPPKSAVENCATAIMGLDPGDIIVQLDGDDWFPHDRVLEHVERVYASNPQAWLTYGSYEHADGRPSHMGAYETTDYRREDWKASHLKSCRAALFQRLDDRDMKSVGHWRELAWDQATMLPMLEMAGPEHSMHLSEILYVYNYGSSFEHNAKAAGVRLERHAAAEIRALPPRDRLVSL